MTRIAFLVTGFVSFVATQIPYASSARAEDGVIVYDSDFASGRSEHWSSQRVGEFRTPEQEHKFQKSFLGEKRSFLGSFREEAVKLTLDDLPPHARIRISFDFLALGSWGASGANVIDLTIAGGPRLLRSTFSNVAEKPQCYPGPYGLGVNVPYQTGSTVAKNEFAIYRVKRTFAHSGESVKFAFTLARGGLPQDAGWGLDQVKVEILPAAPNDAIDAKAIVAAWETLAREDPLKAAEASNVLMEAGDAGPRELRRLANQGRPRASVENIRGLIAKLDSDNFDVRDSATTRLEALDEAVLPELHLALDEESSSVEVKQRLRWIIGEHSYRFRTSVGFVRGLRWIPVLELIGTEEAKKQLTTLSEGPEKLQLTIDAKQALERLDGQCELPKPAQKMMP